MYIHSTFTSYRKNTGERSLYEKRLLRVCRREGKKVINRTIANLTHWSEETLSELSDILAVSRATGKTFAKEEVDTLLFNFLLSQGVPAWRLNQIDSGFYWN